MRNPFDLTGRVAVITGGGRGIGREIARTLANAGANIVIGEILMENAQDAAKEMRDLGRESLAFQTDVRDPQSVEAMTQAAMDQFGKIDILVSNAGIARHYPAEDTPDDVWLDVMNINLNGVYWCCRSVGRRMLAQGSGSIVNIASMSGSIVNNPQPQAAYNASKAAVIMLSKSLAAEWASRGVRVNSVSPGYTASEMTKQAIERVQDWYKVWMDMTPMKRMGEPIEIAHAVWYLASDAASFATGTDLIVDGGYTAW
jgi:NAD(P)-dependent dehydrogenase (short-subunit alcohol dehydrogenase family)